MTRKNRSLIGKVLHEVRTSLILGTVLALFLWKTRRTTPAQRGIDRSL